MAPGPSPGVWSPNAAPLWSHKASGQIWAELDCTGVTPAPQGHEQWGHLSSKDRRIRILFLAAVLNSKKIDWMKRF